MRKLANKLVLGLLFVLSNNLVFSQSTKPQPPNVLWIIAEDLSPDLGCYGNSVVNTPNLDALAQRGMRFTNVFTTAPVCSPSRTALATGMYQTSIGAYHMRYPDNLLPKLPEKIKTIAQLSQENGYLSTNIKDTPGFGKTDWMFQADVAQQFDAYHWKELAGQGKPFFAQLCTKMTHRPFAKAQPRQFSLDEMSIPPYYPDHPVSQADFADYYASIEQLDQEIGQIMDSLQAYGFDKNTIVIFFSDHGRPMTRGKNHLYDSGLKILMIISIPEGLDAPAEYQSGEVNDALISALDITATTLSVMSIPQPEYLQGRVFWGAEKDQAREMVLSTTNRIGSTDFRSRSGRSQQYRYTRNYHHDFSVNSSATAYRKAMHPIYHLLNILDEQGELTEAQKNLVTPMPTEELYDLNNDPFEIHNLASEAEYAPVLDIMRSALDQWITDTNDQGLGEDSPEIKQAFDEYRRSSHEKYAQKIEALHQEVEAQIKTNPVAHEE